MSSLVSTEIVIILGHTSHPGQLWFIPSFFSRKEND